ncbi:MAG: HD domain-containing phosphohydrolase [Phycisphaerae bacterium]
MLGGVIWLSGRLAFEMERSAQPQIIVSGVRQAGIVGALLLAVFSAVTTSALANAYERKLADARSNYDYLIERRGRALRRTHDAVIFGLAKLAESRDDDTGEHLDRIRVYTRLLAEELSRTNAALTREYINTLELASSLHDIGKVGVPDAVLLKEGPLTPREREIIEHHPLIGGDCLLAMRERMGDDHFLDTACEIAFAHHERWDGTGYPFGLCGEQIPLPARIVALADVYDALTTRRTYKPAFSHKQARQIILEGRARHFDPHVVDAFLAVEERFREVSARNSAGVARPPLKKAVEALAVAAD